MHILYGIIFFFVSANSFAMSSPQLSREQIDTRSTALALARVQQQFLEKYPNQILVDPQTKQPFNFRDLGANTFARSPRGSTILVAIMAVDTNIISLTDQVEIDMSCRAQNLTPRQAPSPRSSLLTKLLSQNGFEHGTNNIWTYIPVRPSDTQ